MSAQLLADRYELGERLGSGGMSTVVLALDRRLERHVAIKLLAEHLADDRQFVARFRREALSVARLVHPNIVQVFDFGLDEHSGRQYIVMEYVQGQSCAEILRERGQLPVPEALGIISQACRGLDYAHQGGVVHRDVKPGNLLRSDDGVVKLADFGIAKAISEESSITQVGSVLGTAAYLAPEQATGQEATARSDIYGLGVVTYQLLSGRLPYEAATLTELALKQQREAPALLDQLNPEVTPELAAAVDRALALEPEDRYATAEELRQALSDGARGIAWDDGHTGAARATASATHATSIVPRAAAGAIAAGPATPVQRRQPIQPAQPRNQPPPAIVPPSQAPARRRRRLGPLVVLLLALAAGAAVVVIATTSSNTVRLRQVVYPKVERTVTELQQLIRQNTR
ncbi:MAG TPA: protein kinase [Solirubrobacteraceae bacterium]